VNKNIQYLCPKLGIFKFHVISIPVKDLKLYEVSWIAYFSNEAQIYQAYTHSFQINSNSKVKFYGQLLIWSGIIE